MLSFLNLFVVMARRKLEDSCNTTVIFRVTEKMKEEIDRLADSERMSTADWLRHLVEEKIQDAALSEYEKKLSGSARAAVPAGMEDQLRQIVWSCLNEVGLPYKKDGSAAADKERSEK